MDKDGFGSCIIWNIFPSFILYGVVVFGLLLRFPSGQMVGCGVFFVFYLSLEKLRLCRVPKYSVKLFFGFR